MAETSFPIIRVDEWELRRIFNDLRIADRADRGELRAEIKRSRPVTDTSIRNWVLGTLSQEVRYYDAENNLVAKLTAIFGLMELWRPAANRTPSVL
jgi:hypothetical protein